MLAHERTDVGDGAEVLELVRLDHRADSLDGPVDDVERSDVGQPSVAVEEHGPALPVHPAALDGDAGLAASLRSMEMPGSRHLYDLRYTYGCIAEQGRRMFEQLGGTQVIREEGHFGDIDDPHPTFELLDKLID
jgi:hypothetical protein